MVVVMAINGRPSTRCGQSLIVSASMALGGQRLSLTFLWLLLLLPMPTCLAPTAVTVHAVYIVMGDSASAAISSGVGKFIPFAA